MFLFVEAYDSCWLFCFSTKMILNILQFDLVRVLWWCASKDEVERLLLVMESTNFAPFPEDWSRLDERRNLGPGRRRRGVGLPLLQTSQRACNFG